MDQLNPETLSEIKDLFDALGKASATRPDENVQNSGDSDDRIGVHFATLQNRLDNILSTAQENSELFFKTVVMKHSLTYEEAKLHLNKNEAETARDLLERTLERVEAHKEHPQVAFLYIKIVNHLAYLLAKKGELERAKGLLEEATKERSGETLVYSTEDLFCSKASDPAQAENKLTKLTANNLQMLGWVYGNLGDHNMYTLKLHEALQQLLKVYDNDLVQWACRCIRLALLFSNACQYAAAKYHLSAAGTVLDNMEAAMSMHPELGKAQADLARCWIHYALHLFGTSKKHLLEHMCKEDGAFQEETSEEPLDERLLFADLDVMTDPVPACLIKKTEQARELFTYAQVWLKRVRIYYTIRDYPILYVNAILNQSELYRYLAFYEPDIDGQYRIQKLRADSLEQLSSILKEIRPKCYLAVSVELVRELAEVQIELMSINLRKLYLEAPNKSEYELRRRMQAVSDIHTKLEGVGDMLGHANLEERDVLEGSEDGLDAADEEVEEEEEGGAGGTEGSAGESATESEAANEGNP